MTITANTFEPRSLARMLEIRKRPRQWYLDMYYTGGTEQHGTRLVQMDVLVAGQKMAPIQRPTDRSAMMARDAAAEKLIKLPYMKPGRPTNAEEIIRQREAGSHLYSPTDLVARAQRQIGRDIEDLDDMISRRVELMAAKGLLTGKTPLVSTDDDGLKWGVDAEVDWAMPSDHIITISVTADKWDASTADPIGNFRTWGRMIAASAGLSGTLATLGTDASEALMNHAGVKTLLDNRRIEAGNLELNAMGMDGITYLGRLNGIDLYEDARTYAADTTGTATPYTPAKSVVFGARNAQNRMHYGPISDLKCPNPLVERWVKTWETDEPSQRLVAVHSSPLPAVHQPDAHVSVTVL